MLHADGSKYPWSLGPEYRKFCFSPRKPRFNPRVPLKPRKDRSIYIYIIFILSIYIYIYHMYIYIYLYMSHFINPPGASSLAPRFTPACAAARVGGSTWGSACLVKTIFTRASCFSLKSRMKRMNSSRRFVVVGTRVG